MDFDKKIIELRKSNNLTQEDLAEKLNVSRQTVSNWETAKCYPDIETLVLISNKFDISLDVLIKENVKMIKDIDKKVKISKKLKYSVVALFIILAIGGIALYVKNYEINVVQAKNIELKEEIKKITEVQNNNSVYTFDVKKINIENLSINNKSVDIYINDKLVLENANILSYYDKDQNIVNDYDKLEYIIVEVPDDIYTTLKTLEVKKDNIVLKNTK